LWAGALPCNKKKSREENAFGQSRSLWYEFFLNYALRVERNYQHGLDAGPLEFQFLRLSDCLTNPFRSLSLCFGLTGKTPGFILRNNFDKRKLSAWAVTMSWQDVTRSSLLLKRQGVEQNVHTTFSFPNTLSESEEL
jgi:hypothetical protein